MGRTWRKTAPPMLHSGLVHACPRARLMLSSSHLPSLEPAANLVTRVSAQSVYPDASL